MYKLGFDIFARDKASPVFDKFGKKVKQTEDTTRKSSKGMSLGMAGAGIAAVAFGEKSISKFEQVGKETLRLQRYIGGTAESASRLRFVATQSGVDFQVLTKSVGILSKHMSANDKAWKSIGIEAKDASGKMKPMDELLPQISDKFAKMPAGPEKTALAMKLFGKSGVDMLPMLNKGADGIEKLKKQSDEFGNTLSDKDTQAVKDNIVAKREWSAALTGVQILLARDLFPTLTKGVAHLAKMAHWFGENSDTLKPLIKIGGSAVAIIWGINKAAKAYTAVQAALNIVMSANPLGIVIIAMAALAAGFIYAYKHSETFRKIVDKNFAAAKVGAVQMALVGVTAFRFLMRIWLTVVSALVTGAAKAFGWVPGIGPKLKGAAKAVEGFKKEANASLDKIHDDLEVKLDTTKAKQKSKSAAAYYRSQNWTATGKINIAVANARAIAALYASGGAYRSGDGPGAGGSTLKKVRAMLPNGAMITSTYRSPAENARVGGSPTSYHMDRNNPAVDIGGPTSVLNQVYRTLAATGPWRELLWQVPGHYDHVHVAHRGGTVSSFWPRMPGDKWDERTARLQVGETVVPRGGGGKPIIVQLFVDGKMMLTKFVKDTGGAMAIKQGQNQLEARGVA